MDHSSLVLLEHINLNVPSHEYILPFYYHILGCGMDPRKAENLQPGSKKKTLWANCGASQVHLPYGDIAQRIPGEIGLWIREQAWDQFCLRVQSDMSSAKPCIRSYERGIMTTQWKNESNDNASREFLKLTDQYFNVYVCRPLYSEMFEKEYQHSGLPILHRQPIISKTDTERWGSVAEAYGRENTECMGIAYVEFTCPKRTAHRIANFYKTVLEAPVMVEEEHDAEGICSLVAKIGFGKRLFDGNYSQYLIFRESDIDIGPYDGHHVALYVSDFDRIFRNVEAAGMVWVNPRFDDKATDMESARRFQQFRFKDITSEDGKIVFELEHEVRSLQHNAWPGEKQP